MKRRKHVRALAARTHTITLALNGDGALPSEFRLFTAGWNETENGKFLFDGAAAKAVMASFQSWGVDLAIDLEHQMLNVEEGAPDPTARDARGWCRLELRGGELWAVDVKWTPDGAARLSEKRQRYVSPAFETDPKTKRVLKMINVAITAMPATHNTPALVAASALGETMDYESVKKALDALHEGDHEAATEILKQMVASAASGENPSDPDGGEDKGAEGVPAPKENAVIDPKVVANAEPEHVPAEPQEDSDEEDEKDPKKKTERKAMRAMLRRTTGTQSFAEALNVVEAWRVSHVTLATERAKLAKDRAVLEAGERVELARKLVKCGAEFPATVWANETASALKPRWTKMPIDELREHVTEQLAARTGANGGPLGQTPKPPTGDDAAKQKPGTKAYVEYLSKTFETPVVEIVKLGLDETELRICAEKDCDPKVFAGLKARRDGTKG